MARGAILLSAKDGTQHMFVEPSGVKKHQFQVTPTTSLPTWKNLSVIKQRQMVKVVYICKFPQIRDNLQVSLPSLRNVPCLSLCIIRAKLPTNIRKKSYHPLILSVHLPWNINMDTQKRGGWKMRFLFNWVIFRLQPLPPRKLTWLAGKSTMNEDVFPIEHVDFPMPCYFSEADFRNFQGSVCAIQK